MTVHPLARPRRKFHRLVRPIAIGALAVVALAAVALAVLFMFGGYARFAALHAHVGRLKPYLVTLQLLAIGTLWLGWPSLVDRLRTRWPDPACAALLAARHRICIGLLLIELVVVLGLPFSLL